MCVFICVCICVEVRVGACHFQLVLRQGLSLNLEFIDSARLADQQASVIFVSASQMLGLYRDFTMPCPSLGVEKSKLRSLGLCAKHFTS